MKSKQICTPFGFIKHWTGELKEALKWLIYLDLAMVRKQVLK